MRCFRFAMVAVVTAAVLCTTGSVSAAAKKKPPKPPSTKGWTLKSVVKGDSVQLLLGINNASLLSAYDGILTKTWGDPTATKKKKFIKLGKTGGYLQYLTISLDGDPQVNVQFSVVAGTTTTNFVITPTMGYPAELNDLVSFPTMAHATAQASAGISVTDRNGDGATATGGFGNFFYKALYNNAAGPYTYADLLAGGVNGAIGTIHADAGGSKTQWDETAWMNIYNVSDISAQFAFSLTPGDSAAGTSTFKVLAAPEPGSVVAMLTGFVGLASFVNRRKRR